MRWIRLALGLTVACGSSSPAPSTPAPTARPAPVTPAPAVEPAAAEPVDAGPRWTPATPANVAGCATLTVSLDSRALPTSTSIEHYDLFVRGEAWDLANAAPPGPEPRVWTSSGSGGVDIAFDASSEPDARSRCQSAVDAYLPTAPRLAGSMRSAATVTTPCHACPPTLRAGH